MEDYIAGNKAAWEEAFELRDASWGRDIPGRVQQENYPFFNKDMVRTLKKYDMSDKTIGQFCCNNGRELLSLVKSSGAAKGIGFDIAENQVAFANEKAEELSLPCAFIAVNILEIDESFNERFDFVLITIGALNWFKDLKAFFRVVSRCMKKGGTLIINEQHPFTGMMAVPGEEAFDKDHQTQCRYSYFSKEWVGNEGMHYMTKTAYASKTFTDYSHPLSETISALCENGLMITGMQEFDYDISDSFEALDNLGFPLSMILEAKMRGGSPLQSGARQGTSSTNT